MNKTIKKVFSVLLVLSLLAGLSVSAFAENGGPGGTPPGDPPSGGMPGDSPSGDRPGDPPSGEAPSGFGGGMPGGGPGSSSADIDYSAAVEITSADSQSNQTYASATSDESALLMASWPHGRLEVPFPYFGECMTGFEYAAAVGMLYEGQTENGLRCIGAIRERFDGARRSPFNEPECGFHYARSMASWAAVLALSDFHYSGVDKTMSFTSVPGRYFWSNGYAFGICEVSASTVKLEVLKGSVELNTLNLTGRAKPVAKKVVVPEGGSAEFTI